MKTAFVTLYLAQSTSQLLDEVGLAVSILLTLTGLMLHVYLPRHQITVEERIKDNKITEQEARRQMQFYRVCAPVVTLLGVALLLIAIYDLSQ
jgi:hypothetical protein